MVREEPHRQPRGLLASRTLGSLGQEGLQVLVAPSLLRYSETESVAESSEVLIPGVAQARHLGGYLIGDLGTRKLDRAACTDDEISTGDHADTVTMPLRGARAVLVRNLRFPGLRRFHEERCRTLSQLLQIATLASI